MKKNSKYLLVAIGVLLVVFALSAFWQLSVVSQISSSNLNSSENGNVPVATIAPLPSALKTVSNENARLKNNLTWVLGNKEQRGWYLYEPLIQRLIATEHKAETSEFSLALACWQQENAMQPTGMLDSETLNQMLKKWQAQRIANKEVAAAENLFAAPISDFYDPTREASLLKVERGTYLAYKRMVAEAAKDPALDLKVTSVGELAADEKRLKIISAFRSPEYQEKLRKASPSSSRTALALTSAHFTGRALDIYVGGEPVITRDDNRALQINTPVYKWLVKNGARFGFYPYYYEPWHWEYVPENAKLQN